MFERFKNPDGKTYNGVAALAAVSGLDPREVSWMATRCKELAREGKTAEQMRAAIKEEGKTKPWLQNGERP